MTPSAITPPLTSDPQLRAAIHEWRELDARAGRPEGLPRHAEQRYLKLSIAIARATAGMVET